MSFLDFVTSLLVDPTAPGGGAFARLFDLKPDAPTSTPTIPAGPVGSGGVLAGSGLAPYDSGGILGNSPIMNMVRSGAAGMASSNGYSGFGPQFSAGLLGATHYNQERHLAALRDALARQAYDSSAPDTGDRGDPAATDSSGQPSACQGCLKSAQAGATAGTPVASSPDPQPGNPGMATVPSLGEVWNGYQFLGSDPTDPNNWRWVG